MSASNASGTKTLTRSSVLALLVLLAVTKFLFAKVEYWSPLGSQLQNERGETISRFGDSWVDGHGNQISRFGDGWITNSGTTFSPFGGGFISLWGDKQIMPTPSGVGWVTDSGTTISPFGNGFVVRSPDTYFQ